MKVQVLDIQITTFGERAHVQLERSALKGIFIYNETNFVDCSKNEKETLHFLLYYKDTFVINANVSKYEM